MALPQLTEEQRKLALKKATEAREKRAEIRRKLKSEELTVKDVLNDSDNPIVARLKVSAMIQSLPGLGKVRSDKIMEELGIDPSRRIGGLGSRQREALTAKLG